MNISFELNGKNVNLDTDGSRTLLWVLRDEFQLTGTKYGCGEGECGACTILIDDKPMRSCQYLVMSAAGKKITTIEGLAVKGKLHPLQEAFIEHDAMQCGFCTSGMIINAVGLLQDHPSPDRDEIDRGMHGNLCRCGSHTRVIAAIGSAADAMKGGA